MMFLAAVLLVPLSVSGDSHDNGRRQVNCNRNQTLSQVLSTARPGDTIHVSGTCNETIVITTDGLTLIGEDGATIDAGGADEDVVTIDGARDVSLSGFTIQNGNEGILAINDATFDLDEVTVQDNDSHAIELVRATANITNITSQRNGRVGLIVARNSVANVTDATLVQNLSGLVVFSNSTVRLFGSNLMNDNATQGVSVGLGGVIFSIGSEMQANDNGAEGVFVLQTGKIQLIGGVLQANRNQTDGLNLEQHASVILGIEEFGVPGVVSTNDNARHGVALVAGSDLAASAIMPLTSVGNGQAGLQLDDGSSATVSGATIEANGGADVALTFGARATLNGNTIGDITCDGTSLVRGDTGASCPTP
ncbi:MAG: right-handed parallel beta-helix repeat-containing protein, partial [Chloroflexota bacterium]